MTMTDTGLEEDKWPAHWRWQYDGCCLTCLGTGYIQETTDTTLHHKFCHACKGSGLRGDGELDGEKK